MSEAQLIMDPPPLYSDVIYCSPDHHNRRRNYKKVGGLDVKGWYFIFTVVLVLADITCVMDLYYEGYQSKTMLSAAIILLDIFLLLSAVTDDLLLLKYVEVFSHLKFCFHLLVMSSAPVLYLFHQDRFFEFMNSWRHDANYSWIYDALRISMPASKDQLMWFFIIAFIVNFFEALFVSIRRYLAMKLIKQHIYEERDLEEMESLVSHV